MLAEIKRKIILIFVLNLVYKVLIIIPLIKVKRGHTLAEFLDATHRIKKYELEVCAHLILNLPWDDMTDVIENAKVLSAIQVDQVKLHALYIVKGTQMAREYEAGQLELISKEEYIERVITF